VFVIGVAGATFYSGRFNDMPMSGFTWSGQMLAPGGFMANSPDLNSTSPVELAMYSTYILLPATSPCPSQYQDCEAYLWGGIGGWGGGVSNTLIQNGYILAQGQGETSELFAETTGLNGGTSFATIMPNQLPAGALASGKNVIAQGWTSDFNGAFDPAAPYASFQFQGTDGNGQPWTSTRIPLQTANGGFQGLNSEAIVEFTDPNGAMRGFPNFGQTQFIPLVSDSNYNSYTDFDTPWIFIVMADTGGYLLDYPFFASDPNVPAYWNHQSGVVYQPSDPYDQTNTLGPFQVKWLNSQ
jgi:hypothetical protein